MAYGATQRLVSRMAKVEEEELGVLGHGIAGGTTCPTKEVDAKLDENFVFFCANFRMLRLYVTVKW